MRSFDLLVQNEVPSSNGSKVMHTEKNPHTYPHARMV